MTKDLAGSTLPRWRTVNDPEELHQYCGYLAVLAGCGPSMKYSGMFWWNVKATPVTARSETNYCSSLEAAKRSIEECLKPYVTRMEGGQ